MAIGWLQLPCAAHTRPPNPKLRELPSQLLPVQAVMHGYEKNRNHHRLEVVKHHIQTPDNPHVVRCHV